MGDKFSASSIARMAGNIAAGYVTRNGLHCTDYIARECVVLARMIAAEVERQEQADKQLAGQ